MALKSRNDDKASLGGDGKKVADVLRDTLCYTGGDGNPGEAANRANWFSQSSMTFRIEARGQVNNSEKVLTAVVERLMPDPKKNEKMSYRTLFWKMQ